MEHEAWPSPQTPREPLPRVEDLPVAEQGYEPESVKAAFDSFYRHAAQLDAALRTLEAVDSFHRHAASLRADLRALRAAGWTQQSWNQPPAYGYGVSAPREGVPPAVWRIGGEVLFLVAAAVALGVAQLSWWVIVAAMAGAFAIVCAVEWLAGREQLSLVHSAAAGSARVHPVVEAERADDTDEHESRGWRAFEEAQEPSDAMTIIGAPPQREEEAAAEAEPEPQPDQPGPEPEPDLPPAAVGEPAAEPGQKRWWRRRRGEPAAAVEPDVPRHVRVLDPEETEDESRADPWEEGIASDADAVAEVEADQRR